MTSTHTIQPRAAPNCHELVPPTRRDTIIDWLCHATAIAVTVGWVMIYAKSGGLVDEPGHLANIHHFLEGQGGWPAAMPMLPGYHFMVVSVWKIFPVVNSVVTARLVTGLTTLLGLAVFALAWQRIHRQPAGRATLLLALLPLTQPFTGMIYTDVPALAFVLAAWWAQVAGFRVLAVVSLAGAIGVRQTSLAWAVFFIAWEFLRTDQPRVPLRARIGWMVVLLAISALIIVAAGRLTVGTQHGNDFRPNPAMPHFAALLLLGLGLPVWLAHASQTLRIWRDAARRRPGRAGLVLLSGAATAAVFAFTFSNPHIWNRELHWEGCSFTLLRNWPLVWIDAHPWLRVPSAINIVVMAAAVVEVFRRQRCHAMLWIALAIGITPALTNRLIEPRYFIPAAGILLTLIEIPAADWRRLAVWWAVLSAIHAPFVARALSLW